jgi:hypothetical protein
MPHAVLDAAERTRVVLGVSREGIDWEAVAGEPAREPANRVHLVVLVAGGADEHLEALSSIVSQLKAPAVFERLRQARNAEEVHDALARAEADAPRREQPRVFNDLDVSALTVEQARMMAQALDAARIVIHADAIDNAGYVAALAEGVGATIVTGAPEQYAAHHKERVEVVALPARGGRRSANVKFGLLFLLSEGVVAPRDMVVNVFGVPGSGYFDSIRLSQVGQEFDVPLDLRRGHIAGDIAAHVLNRVLHVASTLAGEGREGKSIGSMFVLGDYPTVRKHTHQLIVNPFHGYPEDQRNILDPNLEETIKEYAKIDGAFVIRGDGVVVSAGTFIQGGGAVEGHESGLGSRHAAALSLSGVSSALVIALSESTRRVSLFHRGRRLLVF